MPTKPPKKQRDPNRIAKHSRCTICLSPHVRQINRMVHQGRPFPEIVQAYIPGENEAITRRNILSNHVQNCLNTSVQAVIQKNREKYAVDVIEELKEQIAFAKELRNAARRDLTNPDTGELDLSPRAEEIFVHYEAKREMEIDPENGKPTKGRRRKLIKTLQELLDLIEETSPGDYYAREKITIRRGTDPRQFALNCIGVTDSVIDKFARMGGLYKADATNPNDVALQAAEAIALVRWGVTLANCAETKTLHAKGQNVSLEFAISTLDPLRTGDEDNAVYDEMKRQLLGDGSEEE